MSIDRLMRFKIEEALTDTPVVLLHGARQVGKTTLAKSFERREYFTLDNATTLAAAKNDPTGFVRGLPDQCTIDEIQLAPELLPAIKEQVDNNRQPGAFLLTGSANILLVPKASESLAGRMEIIALHPLAQTEIAGTNTQLIDQAFSQKPIKHGGGIGKTDLIQRILEGGYPEPRTRSQNRRQAWFDWYITSILTRDVRDLANIEGLSQMPRLLGLLAARSANLLNMADLANNANIAYTTLQRYMTLLEAVFLISLVQPWSGNLTTRLVKSPKVYLIDTALNAALLGANQTQLEINSVLYGGLLETFVMNELRKLALWSEAQPKVFHFRTQAKQEVDVILEHSNGQLLGFEVKASATVTASDFKGLKTLQAAMPERFVYGAVLYSGDKIVPFGENLSAIPLTALWM
jgi:uncharacterized protein